MANYCALQLCDIESDTQCIRMFRAFQTRILISHVVSLFTCDSLQALVLGSMCSVNKHPKADLVLSCASLFDVSIEDGTLWGLLGLEQQADVMTLL